MKKLPIVVSVALLMGAAFSSCNTNKDDDDGQTLPDLTATLDVTGAVTASYNFTNPENGGANATHAMIASHSMFNDQFAITGLNTAYTYSVGAIMPTVQTGSFAISSANYEQLDAQPVVGFPEVVDGTVNITSSQVLWTVGATTIYSIDGNWTVNLSDGETPPSTITFSGTFDNLAVTGS